MQFKTTSFLSTILLLTLFTDQLKAQAPLPVSTNIRKAYKNHTRDLSGRPGKAYWQNNADYQIVVNFAPETRLITGKVGIDYQNNSPDTLKQVVFKLYPNIYQQQAMRNVQIAPADLTTGVNITNLKVNGEVKKQFIRGTNMYIKGTEILPGAKAHFDVDYNYTLNKGSFTRTGEVDSGAYMIAYFFPRVAVYDDLDGWNEYPYIGKEEFYNDYCNFKAEVTIPGNYQCWATGNLVNTDEVYNPEFARRISEATQNDSVTNIITQADLDKGNITKANATNTWKFEARNVTDFVFAVSNHYVWQASSVKVDPKTGRRTRVDAVYNPKHKAYQPVINYARKTVELISYKIPGIPFPYPHETIFEGLDATEYPMMVNNLPFEEAAVEFTVHEVFHSLFPFYVGNNETKYSFMDEGWATFSELTLAPMVDPKLADTYDMSDVNSSAGSDQDVPIMTLTPQLYGKARFSNKDLKPALGFHYLQEMLGDSLFLKGLRYYISQWNGKHPSPFDMFNCINTGTGKNLNWFWQNWFFEKNVPDLAISKVSFAKQQCNVVVANVGTEVVPVHLSVYYKDGSKQTFGRSIACWEKGNKTTTLSFKADKPIDKIVLGKPYDVEIDLSNNVWKNTGK
ncbi:M1 family metallopeptidase [Mucilaginibacter sp. CAU 1740]|uniref:M1 family metallopeptidase n=1 Tax=Mucilaginibacter sp. CAU 1740 TaxID=3140365 RepID=UPI00325ADCB2